MNLNSKIIYLILILFFSCSPKKKIEIYLTNKRILNHNAVIATNADTVKKLIYQNVSKNEIKSYIQSYSLKEWDTIRNVFVPKGEFSASKNDLQKTPIVYDSEIGDFNSSTGVININKTAQDRILTNLDQNYIWDGQQYVITYAGKPIFNGYFVSIFSSSFVHWYSTYHNHTNLKNGDFELVTPFKINKCNCAHEDTLSIPNLIDNKQLIEAFRETNRLSD